jgi:hypothetical protein
MTTPLHTSAMTVPRRLSSAPTNQSHRCVSFTSCPRGVDGHFECTIGKWTPLKGFWSAGSSLSILSRAPRSSNGRTSLTRCVPPCRKQYSAATCPRTCPLTCPLTCAISLLQLQVPQTLLRPRFQHTAVVVGESMFVYNGHSRGRLAADLWRYDANPSRRLWTKLATKAAAPLEHYGRALVLTPWRLLSFGGFGDHDHEHNLHTAPLPHSTSSWQARGSYTGDASNPSGTYDDVGHGYGLGYQVPRAAPRRYQELGPFNVLAHDVVTDLWQRIATTGVPGRPRPRKHRDRSHLDQHGVGTVAEHQPVPRARYLSAAILVGAVGMQTRKRGVGKAKVLLFGGDDGVTHLDDMWSLDLDLMVSEHTYSGRIYSGRIYKWTHN